MSLSVLDRLDEEAERSPWGSQPLGVLHDTVARVTGDLPCRANDPELWFAESPTDVELAKALCVDCPVRSICLEGAKDRREPWGVWGGELFLQGVVIPRKRPRGRPRKDAPRDEPVRATQPDSDQCRPDQPGRDDEVAA